ncbi:MAG TPA: LuxR C-terminal-related transcriptional regulator [Candidatus Angelobacter sp.]|nr:LuxR C-terminal-related transcriptional regulator [Candidatus Angelobacter sp.]
MDHLLVVPAKQGVPESLLADFRSAGWRVTVTVDMVRAKQLLQKGDVSGVIMEMAPSNHDPDRLKVLRFVHEFCPGTLVILLQSGADLGGGSKLIQALNSVEDIGNPSPQRQTPDLYQLSPAQKRIAELVAQAYPNREIAQRLKIKEQSVRNEISRIFKRMGVWNRVELALLMRDREKATLEGGARAEWPTQLQPPAEEPLPVTRPSM